MIRVYQSDGTDGYSAGSWGYHMDLRKLDPDVEGEWADGGFASADLAHHAALRRLYYLVTDREARGLARKGRR